MASFVLAASPESSLNSLDGPSFEPKRCEDVFRRSAVRIASRGDQVQTRSIRPGDLAAHPTVDVLGIRVDAKFSDLDLVSRFKSVLLGDLRHEVRVVIETQDLASDKTGKLSALLVALEKRGLRLKHVARMDHKSGIVRKITVQGTSDLVLTALRSPSVQRVLDVQVVGFHNSGPSLSTKFEWPGLARTFRTNLMGPLGRQYEVTVELNDSPNNLSNSSDSRFRDREGVVSRIRRLGLSLDAKSLDPNQSSIHVSGPIDLILSFVRQPAVRTVSRITEIFSEDQVAAQEDADREYRAWLKHDYMTPRNVARTISLINEATLDKTLVGFRDPEIPSLIRFGNKYESKSDLVHEELTAKDFARFVRRHHGHDFGYLAELAGKGVPVYDGIILDAKTHQVLTNISIKSAAQAAKNGDAEDLLNDIEFRFSEFRRKKKTLINQDEWFRASNALPQDFASRPMPKYEMYIEHAQMLDGIFGLFLDGEYGYRESRIVFDVRERGIPFELLRDPDVQQRIRTRFLENTNHFHATLTLLWNGRQGVEIDAGGVRIYE